MGNHRMFSKRIVESTRFLKMPATSQNLYFHLGMLADDDGIVEAYPVMCTTGSSEDDLMALVSKNFVTVLNSDTVTYINDWLEHNTIRADRKRDSIYKDLLLKVVPNAETIEPKPSYYSRKKGICQTNDGQTDDKEQTSDRLSKDKVSKDKLSEDKESKEKIYYQQIADLYNETCVSFPRLTKLSESRKKAIRARMKQYSVDDFRRMFELAESSDFLKGKNDRNWSATFDWMVKDANMAKILDGNYQDKADSKPREETREEREARLMREWEEEHKNRPKFNFPPLPEGVEPVIWGDDLK